jgi:hypothetical protein
MAEPTEKAPQLTEFLEQNFGRTTAITNDRCVPAPIGCGGPATEFRDEASKREYAISGLCQNCQDSIFGVGDDE